MLIFDIGCGGIFLGGSIEKKFKITGMGCQFCVRKIESGVGAMSGIKSAGVNLIIEVLTVEMAEGSVSAGEIIKKVEEIGFKGEEVVVSGEKDEIEEISVGIKGLECQSCVSKIKSNLGKVDGIERIVVNLTTEKAKIRYDRKKIKVSELKNKMKDLGFEMVTEKVSSQGS